VVNLVNTHVARNVRRLHSTSRKLAEPHEIRRNRWIGASIAASALAYPPFSLLNKPRSLLDGRRQSLVRDDSHAD
jgi:hypothetical protein